MSSDSCSVIDSVGGGGARVLINDNSTLFLNHFISHSFPPSLPFAYRPPSMIVEEKGDKPKKDGPARSIARIADPSCSSENESSPNSISFIVRFVVEGMGSGIGRANVGVGELGRGMISIDSSGEDSSAAASSSAGDAEP